MVDVGNETTSWGLLPSGHPTRQWKIHDLWLILPAIIMRPASTEKVDFSKQKYKEKQSKTESPKKQLDRKKSAEKTKNKKKTTKKQNLDFP
jgi:beta-lactamase regulating signal transducer with metallopeptidase domain